MKTQKRSIFLFTFLVFSAGLMAQEAKETKNKKPHLTFTLHENEFYYTKGGEKESVKIDVVDSIIIARIIDTAIITNKVAKKDLNVHLEGDELLNHPKFEVLLNTILSRTVSEVRLKTNVFE